ncbi:MULTISPECIES: restriction endonuclease subunit S [unclassified Methanoculleus]|uniref:restriction endonuclease subunit S n=1 Tax=unclassified Methanoculleus TaxID=2619537 RepID=UPI0025DB6D30|nr:MULTISPECIES: restriction endonuclease subunit S [unclassified Methanoculleus]
MQQKSEVPEGWACCKMGEISQIIGGGTPTSSDQTNFEDNGFPWLTPADLSGFSGKYIERGSRSLSEKGLKTSSAKAMPAGTVLMSSRAPIGYLAIAANPICTNQGFKSFILKGGIFSDYIFYWLKYSMDVIESMASGTTFKEISGSRAKEIPVLVPPLPEQHRIAAAIETLFARLDAANARLERVPGILKQFRQSIFIAAFSGQLTRDYEPECLDNQVSNKQQDQTKEIEVQEPLKLYPLPSNWSWSTVAEIASRLQYGASVKADAGANEGIPILRMGNIRDNKIDITELKYVNPGKNDYSSFYLQKGDILFNRTNSPELVGKSAVFDLDLNALFASYIIRIQTDPALISNKYLCLWINSPWGRWWARTVRTDGVSQSNISATKVKSMPIPLPPLPEQHEIVRRVDALFALADKIEAEVAAARAKTETMRQSILAQAFSGRLVPTEAELARREGREYEPASVLLERIRSGERAKKAGKESQSTLT